MFVFVKSTFTSLTLLTHTHTRKHALITKMMMIIIMMMHSGNCRGFTAGYETEENLVKNAR